MAEWKVSEGMSLRDWFAGQALLFLIEGLGDDGITPECVAATSYEMADAMLAARDATKDQADG